MRLSEGVVSMKRGFRTEEKIQGLSFPGLLLLAGIALELVVLSAASIPEKNRSQFGASGHNQLSQRLTSSPSGPILVAYDTTANDKDQNQLALNLTGTVESRRRHNLSPTEQVRVEKLERALNAPRPWQGTPAVAEPTPNSSLPYVSP
jgi:hypothetical protein